MSEIVTKFLSLNKFDNAFWMNFLEELEDFFKTKITHIDRNDPIQRKFTGDYEREANYLCDFLEHEWYFIELRDKKVFIMVHVHHEDVLGKTGYYNFITVYLPKDLVITRLGYEKLATFFTKGILLTQPFYGAVDIDEELSAKNKRAGSSYHPETELLGMFWLTYLDRVYLDYFGEEKTNQILKHLIKDMKFGKIYQFGEKPGFQNRDIRQSAQNTLGAASFVDPEDEGWGWPGKNVPMFDAFIRQHK